ncbi:MAG: hypothetical protein IJG18_06965 [Kiritimatiellae bacterium]|nr:hypothetical protein [Kiritimatiellia bacterium]
MAINLANLNISLDQFQKMATGDYNAGEVALKSESKLTKINNHVHRLSANTKSISHEEVLAIKNAFMKALSANGVGMAEINNIRKELGLAPDETAPKALAGRSLKPLSRQQIRDIIDRNAAAINASRAEHGQKAFKTSAQLYGTNQTTLHNLEQYRRAASDSVRRTMTESEEIANFQKIIEGNAAEVAGEDRGEMLKTILAQRDAIIANAKGNPKAEGNCVLEYTTENGQKILFASSKSERETIRMLDEAYLLLAGGTNLKKRNAAIAFCLTTSVGKPIPFEIKEMADSVRAEATAVFGKGAVAQADKPVSRLVKDSTLREDVEKMTEEGKAVTADNLREVYRANCFRQSALNLVERTVEGLLREMGRKTSGCADIRGNLEKIMPETFRALAEAKTADEAKAILNGAMGTIRETTAKAAAAIDAKAKLKDFMNEAFAREVGVKWNPANGELASFEYLATKQGDALKTDILTGKVKAGTPEEITAEFKKLAQKTAHAHAEFLRGADALGLSGDAVDRVKQHLLGISSFKRLDLAKAKALAGEIDVKPLADAFAAKAPMAKIFEEIGKLHASAESKIPALYAGAREIGADETIKGVPLLLFMALDKSPNLAVKLERFLAGGDVQKAIDADERELSDGVTQVDTYMGRPTTTPAQLAATLGKPDMQPLFAQALMKAADEAGLAQLPPEKKLAAFGAGTAAGRILREALAAMPKDMSPTPNFLYGIARGAARGIDVAGLRSINETAKRFAKDAAMQGKVLAAGYHKSELPMLAEAFAFIKSATGCSDADALTKTLDPASSERRLFQYGGRFTASADNFKAGLKLMDTFKTWFENTAANVKSKNCNTLTEKNAGSTFLTKEGLMGFEKFVFEDIALDPTFNLAAPDPEKAFGIENNKAMNFFARGNGSGCTGTVAQLSPEKRQVVYAVFAALEPPSPQPKGATNVVANSDTLSRILRHFDEIVELKNSGKLDRTHINAVLVPDLDIPPDTSSHDVNDVFMNKLYEKYGTNQGKLMEVSNYIEQSGCTLAEALAAAEGKGPKPKTLPDYSPTTMKIEEIDGSTKGGRSRILGDFVRPENPKYLDGTRILSAEQNHFTVHIGQETFTADGKNGGAGNAVIANRIETLCGKVHVSQASSVMRALSQAAHQPLLPLLPEQGIQGGIGTEHIPLTYTLSRNDETGAITIRYSEPEGMPVKFHWETTVALDGSSTSTPIQFTETLEESGRKALAKTAGGTSPAAKTMQTFILDASGAPQNAPVMEKLGRFNAKLQEETRKDLVNTFAFLVNKNLVRKDGGGNRTEDFDCVHYQFNRDVVAGGMTVNLPGGGKVSTTNYETARDQLVQFITGDDKATYKAASANVKKQTGLLMSIVTQYAPSMVKNAFVSTLSNGGHEMSLAGGRKGAPNPFQKPLTWTLGKAEDGSIKASVTITEGIGFLFTAQGETKVDDTASYEETTLDITIPAGNLSTLADQDWSTFDEGAVNAAGKDADAQLSAIPQQFRLEATVNASYNLHFDAPAA